MFHLIDTSYRHFMTLLSNLKYKVKFNSDPILNIWYKYIL